MAPLAQAIAEISGQMLEAQDPEAGKVSLGNKKLHGKVKIMAVPSEDFSVSPDTVSLRDTTYCCMRSRPRVQDLIARGVDPEIARSLPLYTISNGSVEQERDTAEEHNQADDNSPDDLRMVETRKHYLRIDLDGDGKLEGIDPSGTVGLVPPHAVHCITADERSGELALVNVVFEEELIFLRRLR